MSESKLRDLSMDFSVRIIAPVKDLKANHESIHAGSFLQDGEKEYGRRMRSFNHSLHRF